MEKTYTEQSAEKKIQELWEQERTYRFNPDQKENQFTIDTPPPTVSGKLHIGHIFSYTQTDLIARFRRMQGKNVFYPMGYDDNGLPTELYVEKKNNVRGKIMGRSEFIKLCLKETVAAQEMFKAVWKGMGLSINWEYTYSTIEPKARAVSQRSFIELYKKGLIYRKNEPALYCTTCQTTISQSLLESTEVDTTFNTIAFKDTHGKQLLIATTRPELLASCVAVFYHPNDARYQHLANTTATSPVFGKQVPILADEAVDPEKGTGLVMCCTFGDQTDILWFKTHKLPFIQSIGLDGRWTAATGPLAGLKVHDARLKIIELLAQEGSLIEQKKITHHVHVDERCKREIEYIILNQWFINILSHKDEFLKRADEIEWKPAFMKSRYVDWVTNLSWDWCISRQRFFGVPFPVWHCADCSHILIADEKELPIDPQETSWKHGACPQCNSNNIAPETDVMDTWATSASTPEINANWPTYDPINLPMTMRPQAHDIIRTWAFDTIVKSHYHHGKAPWKEIVISGHALAGRGEKFSKSKGNALLDPINLMQAYSADAIRYWAASGKLGTDILFSEDQLKIGRRLITKLWNAFKFVSEHMHTNIPAEFAAKDPLNQWILHHLRVTYNEYVKAFDAYEYHHALERAEHFFWHLWCDNYLELVKHRLFNPNEYDSELVEETKATLGFAGLHMLAMFAPVVPHVTDTIYQDLYRATQPYKSIHNYTWQTHVLARHKHDQIETLFEQVIEIVSTVRKLKSEHQVSLKTPLKTLTIHLAEAHLADQITPLTAIIQGVSQAQQVVFSTQPSKNQLTLVENEWIGSVHLSFKEK